MSSPMTLPARRAALNRLLASRATSIDASEEVLEFLDERGYSDVEQVTTSTETITFALPRDLRPART